MHNTYVPYPDSKIASEQVVLQAHLDGRVQCTVVRPGDVYGPRARAWAVVPAELIKARRFTLPGGGRGIHSPVYIDNLIDGVALAASSPEALGQVFTLSDGIGVPYRAFFARWASRNEGSQSSIPWKRGAGNRSLAFFGRTQTRLLGKSITYPNLQLSIPALAERLDLSSPEWLRQLVPGRQSSCRDCPLGLLCAPAQLGSCVLLRSI